MYTLVASAINHPDRLHRLWGTFNRRSLVALSDSGVDVNAVVPRPHAPPIGPFSEYRSIPRRDDTFAYPVSHPRFWYLLPKSLFYHRTGDSMASTVEDWLAGADVSGDVYHGCHLYPDGYALSRLTETRDRPLTAYAHGTIVNEYSEFNAGTRERIRLALRRADTVFCSGEDIQAKIGEIVPAATTRVVPIGADPANFPTDRRVQLRRELDVPAESTLVLFCGRFTEAKGVADLREVLSTIDDDSLYFVCIGHGGDLREDLQAALAGEDPPRGRVLWKLDPAAVRRWFAAADLFVLPSYAEGRPTVIYEAMASQTPTLATTVGGIPEQVEEGETGWLLSPGDVDGFRDRLLEPPRRKLREMGVAAESRLSEQGWTWDAHASSIADVHRRLQEATPVA